MEHIYMNLQQKNTGLMFISEHDPQSNLFFDDIMHVVLLATIQKCFAIDFWDFCLDLPNPLYSVVLPRGLLSKYSLLKIG